MPKKGNSSFTLDSDNGSGQSGTGSTPAQPALNILDLSGRSDGIGVSSAPTPANAFADVLNGEVVFASVPEGAVSIPQTSVKDKNC